MKGVARKKRHVRSHRAHPAAAQEGRGSSDSDDSPLSASVLVLNRTYMAVHVVNVRRAICLLFRDLAEVIHLEEGRFANYDFHAWREISGLRVELGESHGDWIRSVNFVLQVPRVIRLLLYDRLPVQHVNLNRRNVLARDGHRCQYCGKHFPDHELSIDHVMPRSRNGKTTWTNVVCACLTCNIRKGGRTPVEAGMKLIRQPIKPKRNPQLAMKLRNPKYSSWKAWLGDLYWEMQPHD